LPRLPNAARNPGALGRTKVGGGRSTGTGTGTVADTRRSCDQVSGVREEAQSNGAIRWPKRLLSVVQVDVYRAAVVVRGTGRSRAVVDR